MTSAHDEPAPEPRSNTELIARYPKLSDPNEAINFALDRIYGSGASRYFLETWRDGGWSEIEAAYPEFIEQVDGK